MSRYSPQVLPVAASPFVEALNAGFDEFQASRQRKAAAQLQATQAGQANERLGMERDRLTADLIAKGFRPPTVADARPDVAPDFSIPTSTDLARGLAGNYTPTQSRALPSPGEYAAALQGGAMPFTPPSAAPTATTGRPGVYDPRTGAFGGAPSPAALMLGQAVAARLRNGLVFDPTQTPEAIQGRQRQQEAVDQEQRRSQAQKDANREQQNQAFRTLSAIEPGHVAVKDRPFNPDGTLDYVTLLNDALKRQQDRNSASLRVTEHGPATLTHPNTVNVLDGTIEDVYSDGTRKTVRKATKAEIEKATYTAPPPTSFTPFQGTDPVTGKPVVAPFDTKHGTFGPAVAGITPKSGPAKTLAAPIAAKVGQFGEMLKKSDDLFAAMDNLDVSVAGSATQDIAEHGLGHIPGTRGIGSYLLNKKPEYAQYQAAISPFVLAAAHALSGARINQDQVTQIRNSIELKPGDFGNPTVRAQKFKNLLDLINSIGGSLPADAIVEQENQMDDAAKERLRQRGYISRQTSETAKPAAGAAAPSGTSNPPAASTAPAPAKDAAAAWMTLNPQLPGESAQDWFARYQRSLKRAP